MRRAPLLVVCLVALLAGCAGFTPAEGPPDREPYTVEDPLAPSLADAERAQVSMLQRGLSTEGIVDEGAFVEAHEAALESGAYVSRSEGLLAAVNGSHVGWYAQQIAVGSGGGPISIDTRATPTEATDARGLLDGAVTDDFDPQDVLVRETWIDGHSVYDRQKLHDGTVVYGTEAPTRMATSGTRAAYALFRAPNVTVAELEGGHLLTSDDAPPVYPYDASESIEIDLVVREDGLIRSIEVDGRIDVGGDPMQFTQRLVYDDGVTEPDPPAWLEEATTRIENGTAAPANEADSITWSAST